MSFVRQSVAVIVGDSGGYPGNMGFCTLQDVINPTAHEGWLAYVATKTRGVFSEKTRVVVEHLTFQAPNDNVNMDVMSVMTFRNLDTGTSFKLFLPAPLAEDIEGSSSGQRVKTATMQEFSDQINLYSNKNVAPVRGIVIQRV